MEEARQMKVLRWIILVCYSVLLIYGSWVLVDDHKVFFGMLMIIWVDNLWRNYRYERNEN